MSKNDLKRKLNSLGMTPEEMNDAAMASGRVEEIETVTVTNEDNEEQEPKTTWLNGFRL